MLAPAYVQRGMLRERELSRTMLMVVVHPVRALHTNGRGVLMTKILARAIQSLVEIVW
jgi:hypothetical protein